MKTESCFVELGERRYPVLFRTGAHTELLDRIERTAVTTILWVSDTTVHTLHGASLVAGLQQRGLAIIEVILPPGEHHKTLAAAQTIYDRALSVGIDRKTLVVAFGGGVVGDIAGFAAATLLRGLRLIQVPTTVLSQVDSSVGGKTAVNHPSGKNLIGAFHQPEWVFADTSWLHTLPARERRAGLAEVIKHGVIAKPTLLKTVHLRAKALLAADDDALHEVIAEAVAIKAEIVVADETEQGRRAVLNFGHTLGHAIEASADADVIRHGEAVALGMVFAAELSVARVGLKPDAVREISDVLAACELPTDWRPWIQEDVLNRMASDKKRRGDRVQYILLEAMGRTHIEFISLSSLRDASMKLARTRNSG